MEYNYPNGYVLVHSKETSDILNNQKGKGRRKIRYDICLRDGNLTIIHKKLKKNEVDTIRIEIERQGNKLW